MEVRIFSLDWYKAQIDRFNNLFPCARASCVEMIDWSDDFGVGAEDTFELRFFQKKSIDKGFVNYLRVGEYRKSPDGVSGATMPYSLSTPSPKLVYVESWIDLEKRYRLSVSLPDSTPFRGQHDVYDFSFDYGDVLIYFNRLSSFPQAEELIQKTKELIEPRYKELAQIASQRNYKSGWLYYKIRELSIPEIDDLWALHGYYYSLQAIATQLMHRFQCEYRPDEWGQVVDNSRLNIELKNDF
jgi:hypothetical protein